MGFVWPLPAMINFIPKAHPSVSLLYGKRPLQRIAVGAKKQQLEVPLDVVADIPQKVDLSASYVGNKYNALPWKEFIDIKLDARNLIDADVKSALTTSIGLERSMRFTQASKPRLRLTSPRRPLEP